jgi:TRAP-type C4-dicarboxylate transport system permease small subunit
LSAVLRTIDHLSRLAAYVAAACLALLAIVVLAEVLAVWLLNQSLEFSWEYGAFLMAAAFFLGLGWTLEQQGHVRVELLAGRLPPAAARWLDIAATALGLIIAAFLTSALAGLAWSSLVDGSRTFTATATPLVVPQGTITLGAAIFSLQLLARLIRLLRGDIDPAPAGDAR